MFYKTGMLFFYFHSDIFWMLSLHYFSNCYFIMHPDSCPIARSGEICKEECFADSNYFVSKSRLPTEMPPRATLENSVGWGHLEGPLVASLTNFTCGYILLFYSLAKPFFFWRSLFLFINNIWTGMSDIQTRRLVIGYRSLLLPSNQSAQISSKFHWAMHILPLSKVVVKEIRTYI